jgi:hypothetical protein
LLYGPFVFIDMSFGPIPALFVVGMTRCTQLLGVALISAAAAVAEPTRLTEYQTERQPGTLRISGLQESDRVMLDGELLGDGKRIISFGSKLLINPGKYRVTVVQAGSTNACEALVVVRENQTAVARCTPEHHAEEQLVD